MVNQRLLIKELEVYKNKGYELKPIKFTQRLINELLDKYGTLGLIEKSYCCFGEEICCWVEVEEEGCNNLTLKDVENSIKYNIRRIRKYLYNKKKYGERVYIYKDSEVCFLFIYSRDIVNVDYAIYLKDY